MMANQIHPKSQANDFWGELAIDRLLKVRSLEFTLKTIDKGCNFEGFLVGEDGRDWERKFA